MSEEAKVTFSINCISGLVRDCGCYRCLSKQGKPITAETEKLAAERSKIETEKFRQRTREFLESCKKN